MAGLRQLLNADEYLQEYDLFGSCVDEEEESSPREKESSSGSGLAALATTIETEIVPRLMLAHRADLKRIEPARREAAEPSRDDVLEFASIIIKNDTASARGFIDDLRGRGVSLESIFLGLMAPAARHLGDLWVDDRCDFMTVTLGLSRMQQLLRGLSPATESGRVAVDQDKRALLVTFPGEQHTFGMYMVAEFFRRDGWDVWGGVPDGDEAIFELLVDDWFDVIGVSVSLGSSLLRLEGLIRRIRECSRNQQIAVLLGGRAVVERPGSAQDYGADAIASDGRKAVSRAQEMLWSSNRRLC
ncbi:MAG: cobalamin B12-binding domain-containing protein [Kiloniellales bacterium]|nr:cobalamin B12-binding domain-containing protein [Kiloniellales bacterium]